MSELCQPMTICDCPLSLSLLSISPRSTAASATTETTSYDFPRSVTDIVLPAFWVDGSVLLGVL